MFILLCVVVLAVWALSSNLERSRRVNAERQPSARGNYSNTVPQSGYSKTNLTGDEQIRRELAGADDAVGGLTDIQKAWAETFLRCKQVMEESFEIAERTKDEITRSSRLEVAKDNLERLESLTRNSDCPLKLSNSDEIWSDYCRLSGSASVADWEQDKPVDLNHFIGRPWGEIVAEMTGGANLVDGKQTWELADEYKHDLPKMLDCCQAELRTMEQAGQIPAPFYFERAAILLRKAKQYKSEAKLIKLYLSAIDAWNQVNGNKRPAGGGARHDKILQRYEKAKQLSSKNNKLTEG
ncbi:hypothetical protein KBY85_15290 [Cyanobium sp. BA5m-10]|uniref:hypothetical protein n=1 Tax=Cyanobium sp. BA5m-10 TaxID=2823705 RepID=UPI0020CEBCB4|nr:hypothetical protein [Cyanobium sp. BA5m-10]MCP9905488.1 hypothetical protein [Cyanobium sp. BA5m-10]